MKALTRAGEFAPPPPGPPASPPPPPPPRAPTAAPGPPPSVGTCAGRTVAKALRRKVERAEPPTQPLCPRRAGPASGRLRP